MRGDPGRNLDRVPGSPVDTREWYDRASSLYADFAEGLEYPPTGRAIEMLALEPGERVVDIGCGAGRAVVEMAGVVGTSGAALGVDFADGMCQETRETIMEAGLGSQTGVVCGDATALPVETDSVDAAITSFLLDLLRPADIDAALLEMARVLRPSARLAVVSLAESDALTTRAYRTLRRVFPTQMDCRPIPAVDLVAAAGFDVERRRPFSLYGLPVQIVLATP